MDWADAVLEVGQDVHLRVEVTPGARDTAFPSGYNPWRRRLAVRVRAQAQAGLANADVVRVVAQALGVPEASVRIVAGQSDRRKTVAVRGISREAAVRRLTDLR